MDATALAQTLTTLLPGCRVDPVVSSDQPTLRVDAADLPAVAQALRDLPDGGFVLLVDIVGVDYLPRVPRYEVNYHLIAPERPQPLRVRLKVVVDGETPHLPSLTRLFPVCGFLEREVWDLLGVVFDGHPDLRRLLTPDDWEGHPLRKDYPVQVNLPVKTDEPLQVTPDEFRANLARDRAARGGQAS